MITEHNVIATLRITNRAYIINQGSVIAEGDAQTIVADEQVRRVYLGSSFGEGITEEEERGLELRHRVQLARVPRHHRLHGDIPANG